MAILRFEDFAVDIDNFRLSRGNTRVPVEPLVFDLLSLLVAEAGRVVTRDEIIEIVWQGRFVSDSTVSTAIKGLRKALGDTGEDQRLIRTVRGRGFEFVAPVEQPEGPADAEPKGHRTPSDPAIYVRVSGEEDNASLHIQARAISARIRTILGRVPLLRIVAPTQPADHFHDYQDYRNRLGVTLLAELFLTQNGDRIHVDASLIDTLDGTQTWSRAFDDTLVGLVGDSFLHSLVRRLEPAIVRAMVASLSAQTDQGPRALLLRAAGLLSQKGWRAATFREAEEMLEKAVEADPKLALAHAFLALIRALGHRLGILPDDPSITKRAVASAECALELENQDSMTLGLAGCALADAGEVSRALPILERAIDSDPDNGHAKTALGAALVLQREFPRAEELLHEGIRISPADSRLGVWGTVHAVCQLAQDKIDGAEAALADAIKEDLELYMPRVAGVAVALAKGSKDDALAAAKDCVKTRHDITEAEVNALLGPKASAPVWALLENAREAMAAE
ncbi:MAG: winged helix-turn-helix domain-containing protein [Pseudomonadota bacterium]